MDGVPGALVDWEREVTRRERRTGGALGLGDARRMGLSAARGRRGARWVGPVVRRSGVAGRPAGETYTVCARGGARGRGK